MQYVGGNKFWITSLFCIQVALTGCGKYSSTTSSETDPSGRSVANTSDYTGVGMVILPGGSGLCTGTVVSEHAVLTAAHCTVEGEGGRFEFRANGHTYSTYEVQHTGQGVVESTDDIAIMYFSEKIATRGTDEIYGFSDSISAGDTISLVGYGCNDLTARTGAGVKRFGTNKVSDVTDFIEFLSPSGSGHAIANTRGITSYDNTAASCFGDSGGPALNTDNKIVGVTHAGGTYTDGTIISLYVNVATNSSNRAWLKSMNDHYSLAIEGL
jgi:V8-like Glu-specific endopeptidase